MDLLDQELEPDAFVWEASAPVEAEESEESQERVAFEVMTLRNVALEALNTLEETESAADDDADTEPGLALTIDVDGPAEDDAPVLMAEADFSEMVDAEGDSVVDADVEEADFSDVVEEEDFSNPADEGDFWDPAEEGDFSGAEYIESCIALLNDKYPDGISELFDNGIAEGLFALEFGKGLISGNEEWTDEDYMAFDAVYMTLDQADVDVGDLWQGFTNELASKLFPDGLTYNTPDPALTQNGPISGEAEWTELDFRALELVKSDLAWDAIADGAAEPFMEFYGGFADAYNTLFPDGMSNQALDGLLHGNGLVSGEAEWTDADEAVFNGLWLTLMWLEMGPTRDDEDDEYMPIENDDGFVYPMPIMNDDEPWMEGEPEAPIKVICDFPRPSEMAVDFPQDDMISL